MTLSTELLAENVRLLKSRVRKYSFYGAFIALVMVVVSVLATVYAQNGNITLEGIAHAHRANVGLWLFETMPFLFALWGLHINSITAYEAGVMVLDQTSELRTQNAAIEHQMQHTVTHDTITDLPNQALYRDRLDQAIHNARRATEKLAVLVLRLSNFKEIVNTLGHFNGDRLLRQVAVRLGGLARDSDTLARFEGNEFAMLLSSVRSPEDVETFLEKINRTFESAVMLEGLDVEARIHVGAALFPEDGEDANTLITHADLAARTAQENQRGYVLYSPKLAESSPRRLTLISELRHAIESNALVLHYQPLADVRNRRVRRTEALVRWQHPRYGLLAPGEFIDLAETSGLIRPLSMWVLNRALEQMAHWHRAGVEMNVAVNFSARTLLDPDLPSTVAGLLASHDVSGRALTCEITETTIMADQALARGVLMRLADLGAQVAIDDFGTGYSSLGYLKKLPVHEIKVDRSFVIDMLTDKSDAEIVHAIIALAHNLGLKVVAEGVEHKDILDALLARGCDLIQGYYISQPMPADALTEWLRESEWNSAVAGA